MPEGAFSSPVKALLGSILTIVCGGFADAPIIAALALPLLIVGGVFCVQGALAPAGEDRSQLDEWLEKTLLVIGTLAFGIAVVGTAAGTTAEIVAARRGQA